MIASITGSVEHVGLDRAVIEVGGVGLTVLATPATLATLRVGARARLATSLVVREDSLTLMGFETDDERDVYEILQSVSRVGPKLALAMLAVHTPDALRRTVATEDAAALTRVPGVGQKGAQRILLEIGDKLGPARGDGPGGLAGDAGDAGTGAAEESPEVGQDVVEALTGLGWQPLPARAAVETVLAQGDVSAEDTPALLRAALQQVAGASRG